MRKVKKILCIIAAAVFIGTAAAGCGAESSGAGESVDISRVTLTEEQVKETSAEIDSILEDNSFSGSAFVTLGDNTVFENSYGYTDKDKTQKIHGSYVYQLSSLTKIFTGVAVMQLCDSGKLSTDDALGKYFEGDAYLESITVGDLLNGVADFGSYPGKIAGDSNEYRYLYNGISKGMKEKKIQDNITRYILDCGTSQSKGKGEALNSNYYLLGRIIEKVSGSSYREYIKTNIINRLGLKNTGFIGNKRRMNGYNADEGIWRNQNSNILLSNYGFMYSSFGIVSSADDLKTFFYALLDNRLTDSDFIRQVLDCNTNFNYGFNIDGKKIHAKGNTPLHTCAVYINTETREAAALLSNFSGDSAKTGSLCGSVYNAVNAKVNGLVLDNQ